MRRWLSLELARHLGASGPGSGDGIAANIVRAYPGDLRSAVLAMDRPQDLPDPWRIERMVWPVLEAIVEADGDALPTGLAVLEGQREGASLYAKGRRIADLFDRYHLYRPHMVRQWARDRLVDGTGRPLDGHAVWQARLWRRVRDRIDEPSPPERLPGVLSRLHAGEELLDLRPAWCCSDSRCCRPVPSSTWPGPWPALARSMSSCWSRPISIPDSSWRPTHPQPTGRSDCGRATPRPRWPTTRCSAAGAGSTGRPLCNWPTCRPMGYR